MRRKKGMVLQFVICVLMVLGSLSSCIKSNQLIPNGTYVGTTEQGTEERIVVTGKGIVLDQYAWDEHIDLLGTMHARLYSKKIDEKVDVDEFVADLKRNFDYSGYEHLLIPHDQVYETAYDDDPRIYYEVLIRMTFANGYEIESYLIYCPIEGGFGYYSEDYETGEEIFHMSYARVSDK